MCFSATASFTAAGILGVIGAATLSKAKPHYHMLAAIPLLFATQQLFEGFLWLSFSQPLFTPFAQIFIYGFLWFAFAVWPLWIPLSVIFTQTTPTKRSLLFGSLFAGVIATLALVFFVLKSGATASIMNHHIFYHVNIPEQLWIPVSLLYLAATIAPFFIASIKSAKIFGTLLAISYTVSIYFYYDTMTSVWCFFAALLSIILFTMVG